MRAVTVGKRCSFVCTAAATYTEVRKLSFDDWTC
jgi:hypothetical protein